MSEAIANIEIPVDVKGHVTIINGDNVIESKNKLTKYFLINLANWISSHTWTVSQLGCNYGYQDTAYQWVYLGTDTVTPTTYNTTSLSNPINTKCNYIRGSSGTTGNKYWMQWAAYFLPGSVSGTIGELGLYLSQDTVLNSFQGTFDVDESGPLAARLSSADGEFTSFTIDTTKPTIVIWRIYMEAAGAWTNYGTGGLMNIVAGSDENTHNSQYYAPSYNWASLTSYMVLGTDQVTSTTPSMTNLVNPIGTSPGTKPNTQGGSTANPSNGVWTITWTGTWNAGTVSGTCGEIGIYLCSNPTYNGYSNIHCSWSTGYMWLRLSVAQSHFTAFSINTGNTLTVSVKLTFTFG